MQRIPVTGLTVPYLATCLFLVMFLGAASGHASAQSLRGSRSSLDRQVAQAHRHDYTFLSSQAQLRRFVDSGLLVPVSGNRDYGLKEVSFPFARPEVRLFIERLAAQYRRACGQQLVVTSLTRPLSHQPHNASDRSVHPTGMAIDLRRPGGSCRAWLERTLLWLEARRLLEATRERRPPHYHVALFPRPYSTYVDELRRGGRPPVPATTLHVVRRGDTLWEIARRHGASIAELRQANGLTSSRIHPGQTLRVPTAQP